MGLSEAALDAHCVDKLEVTNQASKILTSGITWLQPVVFLGNAVVDQLRYGTSLADVASPAPVRWINLYRENFPNNNPSNQPIGTVGWSGYINAVDVTNTYVEGQTRMGVSNLSGSPEGIGYGFGVPVGASPLFFAFTREFTPIDPEDYQQLWFSWRQHASGENAVFRLVIEITDQNQQTYWFASDMAFTNTGPLQTGAAGEFPSEAVLRGVLFSREGSLWRDLTFIPGSTLSLASSARTEPLPFGRITGAGLLYTASAGTTMRFDTFEIYGMVVPEPATAVLLALGGVLLLGSLLRPKKKHR